MVLKIGDIRKPRGIKGRGKRVGRGIGSGRGKTSGRGHKGALSRSGAGYYAGFEGGQMPLVRRIPKRGFTNKFKKEWNVINIGALEACRRIEAGSVVDKDALVKLGLLKGSVCRLKILGKGSIAKSLSVRADSFSKQAKKAIEAAGGRAEQMKPETLPAFGSQAGGAQKPEL